MKRTFKSIPEILIVSSSTVASSTIFIINPSIALPIASGSAHHIMAILITNEYFSKLKVRYTKIRDGINVVSLLHEKTLMIEITFDEKELLNYKRYIVIILIKELI